MSSLGETYLNSKPVPLLGEKLTDIKLIDSKSKTYFAGTFHKR